VAAPTIDAVSTPLANPTGTAWAANYPSGVQAGYLLVADWKAGTAKVTNATCAAKLPPGSRFLP
jgi:hypothetical protein